MKPLLCKALVVRNFLNVEPKQCPRGQSHKPEFVRARILKNTTEINGCWNWNRKISNQGYGIITISQKSEFAHRAAYRAFIGEIPEDRILRHKCDNPKCCNPDHLELGTFKENTWDAIRRGRLRVKGADNPACRIPDEQLESVLLSIRGGKTNKETAMEFGVSQTTISRIRRGVRRAK